MNEPTSNRTLLELTGLPTAAGREQRVIQWVRNWANRRPRITLREDRTGNLVLAPRVRASRKPIILGAHMDHPAFVVSGAPGDGERATRIEATFRGGVHRSYFKLGTAVTLHHDDAPARRGKIAQVFEPRGEAALRVSVSFKQPVRAAVGDVVRWALPQPRVSGRRLRAPACDDLAAVAAALEALEQLARRRDPPDVRVLLTRAEEVGFIGAMAACRHGTIPKTSRVVVLENSKSFSDAPLRGGPIVRVGDRTSTFDPELTHRLGLVAAKLAEHDSAFHWQRKLMPGGTCEASAYQALGLTASCLCLPLLNYHNMNERTGRIDSEAIDLDDYDALVRLLVTLGTRLDDTDHAAPLKQRLNALYRDRKKVLRE